MSKESEYTFKGCLNGALIFLTLGLLIGNFIFISKASTDQEMLISMAVFPGIGLFLVSPNIIIHTSVYQNDYTDFKSQSENN